MSRNLTEQPKGFSVQEELFNTLLNGFKETTFKEDKKAVRIPLTQKIRLPRVAESFLSNANTHNFTREWVGKLAGANFVNEILTIIQNDIDEDDDDEELEEDKDEKKTSTIFGALKFLRILRLMSNLYGAYQLYKDAKATIQEFTLTYNQIQSSGFPKTARQFMLLNEIEQLLKGVLLPLVTVGGDALVKYIDNSPAINKLFDEIDEFISNQKQRIAMNLAVDALITILTLGWGSAYTVPKWVCTTAKWGWRAYKYGNLIYNGAKALYYYKTVFKDFDENDAGEFQRIITEKITIPELIPQAQKVEQELDSIVESAISSIDVGQIVRDKVQGEIQQARDDLSLLGRVSSLVRNNDVNRRNISFVSNRSSIRQFYDTQNTQFRFELSFSNTVNNVFDAMLTSHMVRYNVSLTDESYKNLTDEEGGLHVFPSMSNAKKGLLEGFSLFYTSFNDFIEKIQKNLKEKIKEFGFEKLESPQPENQNTQSTPSASPSTNHSSPPSLSSVPTTNVPPREPKKLRLSERSLQPIHPIFTDGALTGIELLLLDAQDNQIEIKVSNWLTPNPNKSNGVMQWYGENKKHLENYLNQHTQLDILRNEYLNLMELEEEIYKSVELIHRQVEQEINIRE